MKYSTAHRWLKVVFSIAILLSVSSISQAAHRTAEIVQKQGYALVPLTFDKDANRLFVDVKINGRSAALILDTGAPGSLLSISDGKHFDLTPAYAKSGPLKGSRETKTNGQRALLATVSDFAIGPVHSKDLEVVETNIYTGHFDTGDLAGLRFDGLLGANFLMEHGAIIDVQRHELFLRTDAHASDVFAPALTRGGWSACQFTMGATKLYVPAKVEQTPARFFLDTGAPYTNLSALFAKQIGLKGGFITFDGGVIFRGDAEEERATIKDLLVGSYAVKNLELAISPSLDRVGFPKSFRGLPVAGFLGIDFLGNNLAFIDYQNDTLYLKKP